MIYITGDLHGFQDKWNQEIDPRLSPGDILIIAGDVGIGLMKKEETFWDTVAAREYTVLFIDGNHENFAKLNALPVEEWHGGRVHFLRKNVIHLMRGEVYELEGKKIFTFGGGYSIDRYVRVNGKSWWPDEMPSEDEYARAEENLQRCGRQVDYIITHTAPSETIHYLSTYKLYGVKKAVREELPLNFFLDHIYESVQYRHYYFGHFHVDLELWREQTAIFSCIRELESGKMVHEWNYYEWF